MPSWVLGPVGLSVREGSGPTFDPYLTTCRNCSPTRMPRHLPPPRGTRRTGGVPTPLRRRTSTRRAVPFPAHISLRCFSSRLRRGVGDESGRNGPSLQRAPVTSGVVTLPGDFLFLDESGDPGMAPGSSPVLVVSILHLTAESALTRAIKRARKKTATAPRNEMKWATSDDRVRTAVFREIVADAALVAGISAGVVGKAPERPGGEPLYRAALEKALGGGNLMGPLPRGQRAVLTVDAGGPYVLGVLGKLGQAGRLASGLVVREGDSEAIPQLQAADFVAGAIFAEAARRDGRFVEILRTAGIRVSIR